MARSDGEDNTDKGKEVFLSWTGSKLESGHISTIINAAWKKGGMEGHVLSTIFRKSAVTSVHQNHKEMKSQLADLMEHKESTARRNEKRAWYKPLTKCLPPTFLFDWHLPNQPIRITSVACFSSMQIFHAWEKCRLADLKNNFIC